MGIKFKPIPDFLIKKNGIIFFSNAVHRINVNDAEFIQVCKLVYLKSSTKMLILKNVDEIYKKNDWLYFKACGKTEIIFNCEKIYKYFNIRIESNKFDLSQLLINAKQEILNNLFNSCKFESVRKYINLIKNVLNITFNKNGISVKENKFKLPYTLTYKQGGRVKTINVKETF